MPRAKEAWRGHINPPSIGWVPVHATGTAGLAHQKVTTQGNRYIPAVRASGPDGRDWFITFESIKDADGTSAEIMIARMRALARHINDAAKDLEDRL